MTKDTSPPRLEMKGIRKRFGATVALDGVDLSVAAGEVVALVGENGAGKSTLMKVLSGAHAADEGTMRLDGVPYAPRHPKEARHAGVAMIYQELSLAPHLTVEENILLGMEPARLGVIRGGVVRERAKRALAELGHAEIAPDQVAGTLSVGNQQLVEVGRALASGCRILILDEPTSSLTRDDVERLFALIDRLKSQGLAIVYISHFIEEVQRVADRVAVLRDGATVGGGMVSALSAQDIVALMVGRDIRDLYPRSERTPGEVVLEVADLVGESKPTSASLALRRGEVLGIAGLIGSGRTELLRAVFGLDPVQRGTVRVGAHIGLHSPARRWAEGVGMLSEDRKTEGLALPMSIADNITLSRLEGFGPARLVLPSRQGRHVKQFIDLLSIRCQHPNQPVGALSGGNQQKVALARLLHHDVDVLLLDEPTRGIDVASKAAIYQIIDALATGKDRKAACAVLVVSSYLPELMGICDRIAVMCRGRLGPARPVQELDERTVMLEATGSVAAS